MGITWRTTDLTRWGLSNSGGNLTPSEFDLNNWYLLSLITSIQDHQMEGVGIDYIVQTSPTELVFHMTDHTTRGPFTIPVAYPVWRGDWAASTLYAFFDWFRINGGLYMVLRAHTSSGSFDPNATDGSGHLLYVLLIQTPSNVIPAGGPIGWVLTKVTSANYAVTWGEPHYIPAGGTTGEVLFKHSGADYDAIWGIPHYVPVGGTEGQALIKHSGADYDAIWQFLALEQLLDVSVTSVAVGDLLKWDGADWVNTPTIPLSHVAVANAKETIWIPATAMVPRTTNGADSGTVEMSGNMNMVRTLDFDPTTREYAQFDVAMPKSWNAGTVTFIPYWSHAATTVNFGVVWGVDAVDIAAVSTLDVAFGGEQAVTSTGGITNDLYVGAESSAIVVAGVPLAGDLVQFRIHRNVSDGSDTLAVDARLHGVRLIYRVNALSDD